jgi:hypothetical protein
MGKLVSFFLLSRKNAFLTDGIFFLHCMKEWYSSSVFNGEGCLLGV